MSKRGLQLMSDNQARTNFTYPSSKLGPLPPSSKQNRKTDLRVHVQDDD